jgi:hypothetical protein
MQDLPTTKGAEEGETRSAGGEARDLGCSGGAATAGGPVDWALGPADPATSVGALPSAEGRPIGGNA